MSLHWKWDISFLFCLRALLWINMVCITYFHVHCNSYIFSYTEVLTIRRTNNFRTFVFLRFGMFKEKPTKRTNLKFHVSVVSQESDSQQERKCTEKRAQSIIELIVMKRWRNIFNFWNMYVMQKWHWNALYWEPDIYTKFSSKGKMCLNTRWKITSNFMTSSCLTLFTTANLRTITAFYTCALKNQQGDTIFGQLWCFKVVLLF